MTYRRAARADRAPRKPTRKTAAEAIIERLAAENRRALSDWRAVILLRRATRDIPAEERRWSSPPAGTFDIYPLLRQMETRGEIKRLAEGPTLYIYEVTVPYARGGPIGEDEVLMEAHPHSAISHLSALAFHGLTDMLPKELIASIPTSHTEDTLPPGTTRVDWEELALVPGRCPKQVLGRPVRWVRLDPGRFFGVGEYQPRGYPVRVTTPERTLLDGLLQPQLSGGFENVLKAWVAARDVMDLETLLHNVDRFHVGVLRQRVGFVLEEMGIRHPSLDIWQSQAKRGGSSRLVASALYAPTYSERWNLSINAPVDILAESRVLS